MASKVIEFPNPGRTCKASTLIERVTVRKKSDILNSARALFEFVSECELRVMLWHDVSSREKMVDENGNGLNENVFGWLPEYHGIWKDYDDALHSPLIRASRVEGEPFWVNTAGFTTRTFNPFLAEIDLGSFNEATFANAAIVIPVHLPFGQIAVAIFVSDDRRRTDLSAEFTNLGVLLEGLSRRFLTTYVATTLQNAYLPRPVALTLREAECLRWAAFGKTDAEVATILGLSHGTVRYHLSRIFLKLGADNRAQAIFRASQLGYICSPS